MPYVPDLMTLPIFQPGIRDLSLARVSPVSFLKIPAMGQGKTGEVMVFGFVIRRHSSPGVGF